MNWYVVFPLDTELLQMYVPDASRLRNGTALVARSHEAAALALRGDGDAASVRRFAVMGPVASDEASYGPMQLQVVDFDPVPGTETLRMDEGPHR